MAARTIGIQADTAVGLLKDAEGRIELTIPVSGTVDAPEADVGDAVNRAVVGVLAAVFPPNGARGPRVALEGEGDREFIRMNSNSYLGMSMRGDVIAAEEEGAARFGAGPGAVRFISGTYEPHVALERKLAEFHGREAGMIFSAAYATIMGTIVPLVTKETVLISDELNHNCIINAVRLSRPLGKGIYPHLDLATLDRQLADGKARSRDYGRHQCLQSLHAAQILGLRPARFG